MKELKNKEIIIGLIVLIVLCIVAIVLIIRRESPKDTADNSPMVVEEKTEYDEEADMQLAEEPKGALEAEEVQAAIDNLAITDEPDADMVNDTEKSSKKESESVEKAELALYEEAKVLEAGGYHTEPELKTYTGEDMWQLEELYNYWIDYKLEAVDDLIRLPRVRTLTNELEGTNYFYYYGQTDSKGRPSGSGLAVYADNTYYCGDWKEGKRSGQGMYLKIFPDKAGTINGVEGVLEHMYNGSWANDYPNGEGQEHFSFDYDVLDGDCIIANVIGNFSDGYYDGELYIMTTNDKEVPTDWEASAKRGVFNYCNKKVSAKGKRTVWEKTKSNEESDDFYWLDESENTGFGIYGLKMEP